MDPNQQLPPSEPQAPQPVQAPVQEQPVQVVPPVQPVEVPMPQPMAEPAVPVQPVAAVPTVQPAERPMPAFQPGVQSAMPTTSVEQQAANVTDDSFQWQAPEYISVAKPPLWYVAFWGTVVVLMVIAALLIKSLTFVVLIPVMAAALTIYTHRPAHMMQYVVSAKGLYINDQIHALQEFRSFGVRQEESMPSLVFIPTKRFRPSITVYFPQEIGEQLVDFLGVRIPMQEAKLDAFDKLVRRLHL